MITMNRVIPIIGGIVLVIAVGRRGQERRAPTPAGPDGQPAHGRGTGRRHARRHGALALGPGRADGRSDPAPDRGNQKLREQNSAAMDQEKRVADKVRGAR